MDLGALKNAKGVDFAWRPLSPFGRFQIAAQIDQGWFNYLAKVASLPALEPGESPRFPTIPADSFKPLDFWPTPLGSDDDLFSIATRRTIPDSSLAESYSDCFICNMNSSEAADISREFPLQQHVTRVEAEDMNVSNGAVVNENPPSLHQR